MSEVYGSRFPNGEMIPYSSEESAHDAINDSVFGMRECRARENPANKLDSIALQIQ